MLDFADAPVNSNRRQFLKSAALALGAGSVLQFCKTSQKPPNVIFILADQWRAQDVGYAGNAQVHTPNLNNLAEKSVVLQNAISGCPVCSPYRASLMTGQFPLTHGVFYNDKPLRPAGPTLGECFRDAGYATAYIGKWHLKGHEKGGATNVGRSQPVPQNRRLGFEFWRVHECTHDYNHSIYFDEQNNQHTWDGYDAIAQTAAAQDYIRKQAHQQPFFLFLSWGPPHAPYHTAPEEYRALFSEPTAIRLRPNVPPELREQAQRDIAGYYAHIAALDDCLGQVLAAVRESGLEETTILVFTSDHGDMLYSHGQTKKQKPWEESIHVPFLLFSPAIGRRKLKQPMSTPDIMPTLLGLAGITCPEAVEGQNRGAWILGDEPDTDRAVLIECPVPFHQWNYKRGGREYRGLRTTRYTYVRDLQGPWLLYDNQFDEFQQHNLIGTAEYADVQQNLEQQLENALQTRGDAFLSGEHYMQTWNYDWDGNDAEKS